jgi:hypothetical protein
MGYYTMQQEKTPCKIFAFAELQKLSGEATLSCFGAYYREEVLGDLEGTNHQNIRTSKSGWDGIAFTVKLFTSKK